MSVGVDDPEVEPELVAHLLAPLDLQAGRADDEDPAGSVAEDQFLGDQAGLDGLAETDVVGDQQVDARHLERPDERVELVVLDVDAAAERRLERPASPVWASRSNWLIAPHWTAWR